MCDRRDVGQHRRRPRKIGAPGRSASQEDRKGSGACTSPRLGRSSVVRAVVVPARTADYRPHMAPLRVVFADDNYLAREGVAALLTEVPEIDLVELVADPQSLLRAVAEREPDSVLTDIQMPPTHTNEGIVAARQIRAKYPDIGVVVLSQYVEEEYALDLLADGVAGMG